MQPRWLETHRNTYELVRSCARGHGAEVFFARDAEGATYAVKRACARSLGDAITRAALEAEWVRARVLDHPNTCAAVDADLEATHPFIVFPYVEGVDLDDRLRTQTFLGVKEVYRLALGIARALAHVHRSLDPLARNEPELRMPVLVHGDLAKENVRITLRGEAIVLDFATRPRRAPDGYAHVYGRPETRAPELEYGAYPDTRSDVYAFGRILQDLTDACRPVPTNATMSLGMNQPLGRRSIAELELFRKLQRVGHVSTQMSPDERYRSGIELIERLDFLGEEFRELT